MFGREPRNNQSVGHAQSYLVQWRGREVDLSRQVASLKKKGLARARSLAPEERERLLHWAANLVLPAYQRVLEREEPQAARQTAELPYPKADIKLAVLLGIMFHDSSLLAASGYLDRLYLAYTRLADFQRLDDPARTIPGSPAHHAYLDLVREDFAKLTRELKEFCAWLGI